MQMFWICITNNNAMFQICTVIQWSLNNSTNITAEHIALWYVSENGKLLFSLSRDAALVSLPRPLVPIFLGQTNIKPIYSKQGSDALATVLNVWDTSNRVQVYYEKILPWTEAMFEAADAMVLSSLVQYRLLQRYLSSFVIQWYWRIYHWIDRSDLSRLCALSSRHESVSV